VEWVEVTGETIAEAKDRALDRLGVDEADAEFEVIEEPQKSFFGRVKGEARVRARVRPTAPRPKAERNDRRRRNGRGSRDGEAGSNTTDTDTDAEDTGAVPAAAEASAPARDRSAEPTAERPRRTRAAAPRENDAPRDTERSTGREPARGRGRDDSSIPAYDGPQDELVASFVEGLVEAFGFDATVRVDLEDERFVAAVDGNGLGVLIGPRGRTSLAAQEVTRAYVQRRVAEGLDRPVVVDVAGYRGRRRAALLAFVDGVADEVRDSGQGAALEPMSSVDRKLVHDRVAELVGVSSASVGDDPRRRVVIDPAD
jgi:spoIIIJ-associated protein